MLDPLAVLKGRLRRRDPRPDWRDHPFGRKPHATREEYLDRHRAAMMSVSEAIDRLETQLGFAIDRSFLDELALHTQCVIKPSELNYHHGRVLYSVLRSHLAASSGNATTTILETGTARGFSALCMARALADAGAHGHIVTIDVLPHDVPMIWNCIDDLDGERSRRQLLSRFGALTESVVFLVSTDIRNCPHRDMRNCPRH